VSTLLSNQEFGAWIKEREKRKKGQLVYFNTSCWSDRKAIHEIEAADSKILLNIPTHTMTQTFLDIPTNAEHILFDQFRDGKSYEDMRMALQKNEGYKNGTRNKFLFPDESDYAAQITNTVEKISLKFAPVQVRDEDGVVHNLDDAN
jgi:hypothetical protein